MKNKTISLIFILITIAVIIFALSRGNGSNAETAKCIASKSTLYVATGCVACKYQEDLFGDNFQHLNVVDCAITPEKCLDIQATPTWIINNEKLIGAQSIEKLKEATGC